MQAVVVALCDQPFISCEIINQLVEAYHFTGKAIIASEYAETSGVPALFSRSFFSELTILRGDEGAKQVIKKHAYEVFGIPFPKGAIAIDYTYGLRTVRIYGRVEVASIANPH